MMGKPNLNVKMMLLRLVFSILSGLACGLVSGLIVECSTTPTSHEWALAKGITLSRPTELMQTPVETQCQINLTRGYIAAKPYSSKNGTSSHSAQLGVRGDETSSIEHFPSSTEATNNANKVSRKRPKSSISVISEPNPN